RLPTSSCRLEPRYTAPLLDGAARVRALRGGRRSCSVGRRSDQCDGRALYRVAGSPDRRTDETALVEELAGECADAASPDDRLDQAPASVPATGADRLPRPGLAKPQCRYPAASRRRAPQGDPSCML